jgi:YD repeat-containing protein
VQSTHLKSVEKRERFFGYLMIQKMVLFGMEACRAVRQMIAPIAIAKRFSILLAAVLLVSVFPSSAGQERYDYDPIGRLIRFVDTAGQVTEYTYDLTGNIISVQKLGAAAALAPSLASVNPNFVRRGETKAIVLSGQRLQIGTLQTNDAAIDLIGVRQAPTQVTADLVVGNTAVLGVQSLVFSNSEGSATVGILVGPRLPDLSLEPSPLALPPDNLSHAVTLRLSGADVVAHQISVQSSNTAKVVVSPATVAFAVGQTSAQINVVSKTAGFVNLILTSPTLKTLTVPVFITADFRGVNTSYSAPVGIVVGSAEVTTTAPVTSATLASARVGVAVGAYLKGLSPKATSVGTSLTLVVEGESIPAGASVSILPAASIVLGSSTVALNGKQISIPISVDGAANAGVRRVIVKDATGVEMLFANESASQLVLTTGQPEIQSIDPLFATAGTTSRLIIRGKHMQAAQVRILPDVDLRLDAQPSINAAGTEISLPIQIASLAATGARVVQVLTPSGQSSAQPSGQNQWTLVSQIKGDITPIVAQPVGVMVGSVATASSSQTVTPLNAPQVGVVVGAYASDIQPKAVVVGLTTTLTITGQGLQAVQSVSSLVSTGLTLGSPVINSQGTQLTVDVGVDINAPKTTRRLELKIANGAIVEFPYPAKSNFLVAAPAPEMISITPQVIKSGQTVTMAVRGKNFRDVIGVRFEPNQGLSALLPVQANPEGSELSFLLSAASNAPTGPRTMIVTTAGGESSNIAVPANTLYVAQQVGTTYGGIVARGVGVLVGSSAAAPVTQTFNAYAPSVGVLVQTNPVTQTQSQSTYATNVGIIVGPAISGMSPLRPDGILKGSTGLLTITGWGLEQVSSVMVVGSPALGTPSWSVNTSGTAAQISVSVPANHTSSVYGLRLQRQDGTATTRVTSLSDGGEMFSTGALPSSIDSVAPIVLEQGKTYTFIVRGVGLRDVYQIVTEPLTGLLFGDGFSSVQWSTDSFGEKLTVQMRVQPGAALGSRVIRLKVPGGITDAVPVPANTITVIQPQ